MSFQNKQTIIQEGNINKIRKSIKVLQNITRNSYESSLFFDIINNPVEDFMSEKSDNKDKDDEVQVDMMPKSKLNEKVCRIWLGTEEENDNKEENPLFAPWICSGTMKYVHLECMQQWIQNKRHSKETEKVKSYNWKFLEWELWKHKIHEEFEFNGRKYYLLNYERPKEGNYLVLESFTNTPHKTIHVIQISEQMAKSKNQILIKVGRGTEVDVRITDISVSRYHSKIYFHKGEFYWIDNNSKFGTVALLRQPISLPQKSEHFFQIQVGKHLIEMESESHLNMWFWNITNRKNKKFKGVAYKDFKFLIPQYLKTKLDMLESVTNVMETINMEEAENNLNREITKLKMINESQISQRNATLENVVSHEELGRDNEKELISRSSYLDSNLMNNRYLQLGNRDNNTVHMSQDITLTIQLANANANGMGNESRNDANRLKNFSTRDRLDLQWSLPSGNQFTISNNNLMIIDSNDKSKPKKFNNTLVEEVKDNSINEVDEEEEK